MTRQIQKVLGVFALLFAMCLGSLVAAPQAHAQTITCYDQGATLNQYPLDGNNGPAGSTHAYACGTSATTIPPSARIVTLYTAIANAPIPFALQKLKQQNVVYFFFNNRLEGNNFFKTHTPFSNNVNYGNSTGRCGNTVYVPAIGVIAVAIYDTCGFNNSPTTLYNPSLSGTIFHESGHAFAAALLKGGSGTTEPDLTTGFQSLLNQDINGQSGTFNPLYTIGLTPSNWASYTQAQKNALICGIFGTSLPSALEVDFGATVNAVCSGSTPAAAYINLTPTQIAVAQKKMPPYFTSSSAEAWAEEFAVYAANNAQSPANFLPITDHVYTYQGGATVGSITPGKPFKCTQLVVDSWINTLAPPTNGQLSTAKCPTSAGPLQ